MQNTDKILALILILIAGIIFVYLLYSTVPQEKIPSYTYRIVNTYPHDQFAFTEGLAYLDGMFVESTGPAGNSTIRLVNMTTGAVIIKHHLPDTIFGEGATVFEERIAQETETSGFGIIYTSSDLKPVGRFNYSVQGWGITYDGNNLIMSDGSSNLYFLDNETFEYERNVSVTADGKPVDNLNELEFVDGEIYANIWPKYKIARISPENGTVTGWIDLLGILTPEEREQVGWASIQYLKGNTSIPFKLEDCPNGIAYDKVRDRLFVTGKCWPKMFQIEIVPKE